MSVAVTGKPAKSPVEIVIDRVWRFFCSVRWAVFEIAFLALLVLIGTLRGSEVPQWIADAIPGTQGFVDVWYDWDVYHSPVFAVTLAIISIAIAVCTLNRAPGIWQAISNPTVTTTRGFLRSADTSAEFQLDSKEADATSSLTSALGKHRYRTVTRKVGEHIHFYADKNRYAKLATFPFHLALILLLVGGIVASRYGFRDQEFIVAEGQTKSVGHNTGLSVELRNFTDTYNPGGVASDYESDIVVYKDGKVVDSGIVSPNDPMSIGTATIYQSSLIYSTEISVRDVYGDLVWSGPIEIGTWFFSGNAEAPANEDAPAGFVNVPQAGVQVTVVGPDINPPNQPELDGLKLASGQLWVQVQPLGDEDEDASTAIVTQGQPASIGGVNVTFDRETRATVLQVANNPGIPIFIIASILLVGGLAVVFYFPQRRIRGMLSPSENGLVAHFAPLARRDWSGKREFLRFVTDAESLLGTKATVKKPAGTEDWQDAAPHPVPAN
jgi:cytochrome c biogenesis protein